MQSETDFMSDLSDGDLERKSKINLTITAIKRHRCSFEGCNSAFNRPWKLERHINTHTKNRPFRCDHPGCTKDYTNKAHLERHKSLSHSENKPLPVYINCPFPSCMKTFASKWNLKRHYNVHKTAEVFKCHLCESMFKKHLQLKNHLSVHLGLKPFSCKTCSDSFVSKGELKKHERRHKLYQCTEENCQKISFITFHALRRHIKNEHPKWLKCDFCGKTYKNKYTLTEHILSHLPKEDRLVLNCPYDDCKRYYFYQRNLDHHIKSYHHNINHLCVICNETFVNKSKLKKHQELHSKTKEEKKPLKSKTPRRPRKDKGIHRKSMAAILSGIQLPDSIDKNLAQNNITPDVVQYIENMTKCITEETVAIETFSSVNS
ncbi:hypothetical protein RUM44_000818 [Polyplax serrata]|uniref:C2H2-type domain-containing protein n=1 Tax=Polyplax serrata TaxID=468196 RepID=A0ABR1B8P4_POLSC